jgi:hypothetical protein
LIVFVVEAELAVLGLVSKGPRGPLCFEVLIIKGLRALLLFLRAPNLEGAAANIRCLVIMLVLQDSHGPAKLRLLDWADPESGPMVMMRVYGVRIPVSSTKRILLKKFVIVAPPDIHLLNPT